MGVFSRGKEQQVTAERIEPSTGGLFGLDENAPRAPRQGGISDVMYRIKQASIARLPQFERQLQSGFAMDGIDFGTFAGADSAMPNLNEGILMWYAQQSFVPSQMCAIMMQNWLINKACSQMPRDAMRKGYKIIGDDGNELDPKRAKQFEALDQRYNLKKHCVQFVRKGRGFGIRLALFVVRSRDPYYYEKPFNLDGVTPGSYVGIRQIDPYWTAPMLDQESAGNPMSMRFYDPTYWLINGRKIHWTHFITYLNDEVMDFLKPAYIYGGVSLPQQIATRVYAAERTADEGPALAMTKRQIVLKGNASKAMANKQKFDETMGWWQYTRDNHQVRFIDKDAEDIAFLDTTLADLDKVIMNQYQLTCAIARTPATKLLGVSPTGFNSNGDGEEADYNAECEQVQENDYQPLIQRHHQILARSAFRDKGLIVASQFNPLDAPTEAERAETNFKKSQTYKAFFDMGAIDGTDANMLARTDKTLGMESITPTERAPGEETTGEDGEPIRVLEEPQMPPVFGAGDDGSGDDDSFGAGNAGA